MANLLRKWMRLIQETLEEYFNFEHYCDHILDAAETGNPFWAMEQIEYWEKWVENEHYLIEMDRAVFSSRLHKLRQDVMDILRHS